jgi:hypothetical protein
MLCRCSLAHTNILFVHVDNHKTVCFMVPLDCPPGTSKSHHGSQLSWLFQPYRGLDSFDCKNTVLHILESHADDVPKFSCSERHIQTSLDSATVPVEHGECFLVF